MAATVSSKVVNLVQGSERVTVTDITFDNSYPTNGLAVTWKQLGLQKVTHAISVVKVAGTGAVTNTHYDTPNQKLKAFTASAEVGNGVDLSAVTVQITAYGF